MIRALAISALIIASWPIVLLSCWTGEVCEPCVQTTRVAPRKIVLLQVTCADPASWAEPMPALPNYLYCASTFNSSAADLFWCEARQWQEYAEKLTSWIELAKLRCVKR